MTKDYFAGLFEDRPSKIFAIVFSSLIGIVISFLIYGIIWYERFGSDNKRTLINR